MKMILLIDLETDDLLEKATKIHCMGYKWVHEDEAQVTDDPQIIRYLLSVADQVWAHNGLRFDFPVLEKFGYDLRGLVLRDTIVAARLAFPDLRREDKTNPDVPRKLVGSHSLKAWGHRVGQPKQDYDGGFKVYTPEMAEYCRGDVETLAALYELATEYDEEPLAVRLEHQFSQVIDRITDRGVTLDTEAAASLYASLVGEREALRTKLTGVLEPIREEQKTPEFWYHPVTGEKYRIKGDAPASARANLERGPNKVKVTPGNPTSRQQVGDHFLKQGWEPIQHTPTGDPQVDGDTLRDLPYEYAKDFARLFDLTKLIGTVSEGEQSYLKLVKSTGRIHGRINHNGAVTGRCTHSKPNLANPPRDPRIRSLFIPTPGHDLMGWDAKGLELRMFCHYLNNPKYTDIVVSGDIHSYHQSILGLEKRDDAKTFIYAFLYGAGDPKLGTIVLPKGSPAAQARAGAVLRRRFLKEIPGLGKLTAAVQSRVKQGWLRGLDGRHVPIRSKHLALNTLLQSAGAVLMKKVTVETQRLIDDWKLDAHMVLHVHDEFQIEGKRDDLEEIAGMMPNILEDAKETLGIRCPLAGEAKFGANWSETH